METQNPNRRKWIIISNIVIFVVGVSVCLLLYIFCGTDAQITSALCVFTGFQSAAIIISVCLGMRMDRNWCFDSSNIIEKHNIQKDKLIPYSSIQAIVVCSAVDRNFSPFRDTKGISKSVIVIFDNINIAHSYVRPGSVFILPSTSLNGSLSYCFFSINTLQMLMDKSDATVFISQKSYASNKETLDELLRTQKKKIFLSVSLNDEEGQFELRPYYDLKM